MSKRSMRLHHRARMVARSELLMNRRMEGLDVDPGTIRIVARRFADNLAKCSCLGCCNVRRSKLWQGRPETRQEACSILELAEERDAPLDLGRGRVEKMRGGHPWNL